MMGRLVGNEKVRQRTMTAPSSAAAASLAATEATATSGAAPTLACDASAVRVIVMGGFQGAPQLGKFSELVYCRNAPQLGAVKAV